MTLESSLFQSRFISNDELRHFNRSIDELTAKLQNEFSSNIFKAKERL